MSLQPVVIDNGSGTIKAGYAGEEVPKCVFSNSVGRAKYARSLRSATGTDADCYIGKRTGEMKGLLKIKYPIEHGVVTDWPDMERIWQTVYSDELKTISDEHPLLLTEPPLNSLRHRERAAEVLFETFNVPALLTSIQAILALYASGRTTGVVLDSGDGVSHTVPIFDGFSIPAGIKRTDLAGREVTDHMQLLLRKAGHYLTTSSEREIVKQMKEQKSYVSANAAKEDQQLGFGRTEETFELPDGSVIELGKERYQAPEILFRPELIGDESPGAHELVLQSIQKVDIELRRHLFENVLLSGGSTLTKGYAERLVNELVKASPGETRIRIHAPKERVYSTWIGGSILASLSTFKKLYVTSEEYKEDPDIIHRKML